MVNGEEIRVRRERLGLSQTEAAQRAGWTAQTWHNIEAGRRPNLQAPTLQVVAWVLGCPMDVLMHPLDLSGRQSGQSAAQSAGRTPKRSGRGSRGA